MKREKELSASVGEQAALYWEIFHGGEDASPAEHREFGDWVARSPEHVEAYLRVARTMATLASRDIRWPEASAEDLIRDARVYPGEVVAFARSEPADARAESPRGFRPRVMLAMAATLVVAIGAAWMAWMTPETYSTSFGEQRSVLLADGSRVTLNTASEIEVDLRDDHRVIRLVSGEALFDVAHDAARPFDVHAGNTVLRAVGTRFDVDMRPARTTVTVVEGIVAFTHGKGAGAPGKDSPRLHEADRLVFGANGPGQTEHEVALDAVTSWTQRKLIFEHRPLGEVAEEFNRYNRERISIDSERLRSEQITGVFQSNDPASFVSFLAGIPGVQVRGDGRGGHVVTLDDSAVAP
jgi:transmembrane sensor